MPQIIPTVHFHRLFSHAPIAIRIRKCLPYILTPELRALRDYMAGAKSRPISAEVNRLTLALEKAVITSLHVNNLKAAFDLIKLTAEWHIENDLELPDALSQVEARLLLTIRERGADPEFLLAATRGKTSSATLAATAAARVEERKVAEGKAITTAEVIAAGAAADHSDWDSQGMKFLRRLKRFDESSRGVSTIRRMLAREPRLVFFVGEMGETALEEAACFGNNELIQLIYDTIIKQLPSYDFMARAQDWPPVIWALRVGNFQTASFLLGLLEHQKTEHLFQVDIQAAIIHMQEIIADPKKAGKTKKEIHEYQNCLSLAQLLMWGLSRGSSAKALPDEPTSTTDPRRAERVRIAKLSAAEAAARLGRRPDPSMRPPQLAAASTTSSADSRLAAWAALEDAARLGRRPVPSMRPPQLPAASTESSATAIEKARGVAYSYFQTKNGTNRVTLAHVRSLLKFIREILPCEPAQEGSFIRGLTFPVKTTDGVEWISFLRLVRRTQPKESLDRWARSIPGLLEQYGYHLSEKEMEFLRTRTQKDTLPDLLSFEQRKRLDPSVHPLHLLAASTTSSAAAVEVRSPHSAGPVHSPGIDKYIQWARIRFTQHFRPSRIPNFQNMKRFLQELHATSKSWPIPLSDFLERLTIPIKINNKIQFIGLLSLLAITKPKSYIRSDLKLWVKKSRDLFEQYGYKISKDNINFLQTTLPPSIVTFLSHEAVTALLPRLPVLAQSTTMPFAGTPTTGLPPGSTPASAPLEAAAAAAAPPQLTAMAAARAATPPEPPPGGNPSSSSAGPTLPARDRKKRARPTTGESETVTTPQDNQAKRACPDALVETSAPAPRDSSSSSLVWQNPAPASELGSFHSPAAPGD